MLFGISLLLHVLLVLWIIASPRVEPASGRGRETVIPVEFVRSPTKRAVEPLAERAFSSSRSERRTASLSTVTQELGDDVPPIFIRHRRLDREITPPATPTARSASPAAPAPGQAGVVPPDAAASARLYGEQIRQEIMRRLPHGVHMRGETVILFAVARDGTLSTLEIERSSGDDRIDRAALAAARAAAPFPPPPAAVPEASLTFTVPIIFR